ncbi:hypothetical protein SNEBB_007700 [Seison nebaliae]|nr:hypothetical protein SNEBB_007700 [Seison nebaliae]
MNILPKTSDEFTSKEYWDQFFTKRNTSDAFEWYGNYQLLGWIINRFLRSNDKALSIGCGDSTLSADIVKGCNGKYSSLIIDNIDISEKVIMKMKKIYKNNSQLKFQVMDVTKMTYDDNSIDVILDKGTFDALMPNDNQNNRLIIKGMFNEIQRTLKTHFGRYICVSLLQTHNIQALLHFFFNKNYIMKIYMIPIDTKRKTIKCSQYPVFIIIITRLSTVSIQKPVSLYILSSDGKDENCSSQEFFGFNDIIERIRELQNLSNLIYRLNMPNMRKNKFQERLEYYRSETDRQMNKPNFIVYIVDAQRKRLNTYATLVVPFGRETENMFMSESGRENLRNETKFDRLAIVQMLDVKAKKVALTMDDLKEDLFNIVRQFLPSTCQNDQIPFLTLSSDIDERNILESGQSEMNGEWMVFDIVSLEHPDRFTRRFIFKNHSSFVQSEIILKRKFEGNKKSKKKQKGKLQNNLQKTNAIFEKYEQSKYIPDYSTMLFNSSDYYSAVLNTIFMKYSFQFPLKILVLGLGGGVLTTYLYNLYPKSEITSIDIDKSTEYVAVKYFGLTKNKRSKVIIKDGLEYLDEGIGKKLKFDVIILDVFSKENGVPLISPLESFIQIDIIEKYSKLLEIKGIFLINLIIDHNSIARDFVLSNLLKSFNHLFVQNTIKENILPISTFVTDKKNDENLKMECRTNEVIVAEQDYRTDIVNSTTTTTTTSSEIIEKELEEISIEDDILIKNHIDGKLLERTKFLVNYFHRKEDEWESFRIVRELNQLNSLEEICAKKEFLKIVFRRYSSIFPDNLIDIELIANQIIDESLEILKKLLNDNELKLKEKLKKVEGHIKKRIPSYDSMILDEWVTSNHFLHENDLPNISYTKSTLASIPIARRDIGKEDDEKLEDMKRELFPDVEKRKID